MTSMTYSTFDPLTRQFPAVFLQRVFAELNPGTTYHDNFHVHVILEALEDLRTGDERRLAVAMPPRSLKSIMISVAYVAWLLGHDSTLRIICVSYGQELADKMASDCRQVMLSDWYQRLFPNTRLAPKRQAVGNFETTAGGGRLSTSVGGVITGFGADYIIVDDPTKPSEALSDVERNSANEWVQHTLFTRLNDKRNGRILIVMQRLHEDDVIGNVVEKMVGGFRSLSFSAIAPNDEVHVFRTPFGVTRHMRKEGEALHAAREPLEVLHEQRRLLGSRFFSAQYLQAPVPLEGNLVKRAWFRSYQPAEIMHPERVIQSWDTAAKISELNDYSVGITLALKGNRIYVLDVVREKMELPVLKRRVVEEAERFAAELVLIEDKGSGTGLLQELQASGFWRGRPVIPKGDKVMRLGNVTPIIEQGRVHLPASAPWLDDLVHELCGFPGLRHDDQVDAMSQALAWIRDEGNPGGVFHYYREQDEKRRAFAENRTVRFRAPPGVSHFSGTDGVMRCMSDDGTIWLTEQDARPARAANFVQLS
ncbi:MAG: phage terminase large subunit [Pseudomonadota bacterium]